MLIVLLVIIGIVIWTFIGFRNNYIKSNEEFDRTKKLMKAKIISYDSERDISGYSNINDISKSMYFKGKYAGKSNTAIVEIIETGEIVKCSFEKIVTDKIYPIGTIINVFYSKGKDGYDVRSEEYPELFRRSRKIK